VAGSVDFLMEKEKKKEESKEENENVSFVGGCGSRVAVDRWYVFPVDCLDVYFVIEGKLFILMRKSFDAILDK
jgi:hypothetical protein